MKKITVASFAILFVLILSSCGSSKKIGFDKKMVQETFEVEIGSLLEIKLKANPTTGYKWEIANSPDPEVIGFDGNAYKSDDASMSMVGVGGTDTWTFKGLKKGKAYIHMKFNKPNNKDTKVVNKYYEVHVK